MLLKCHSAAAEREVHSVAGSLGEEQRGVSAQGLREEAKGEGVWLSLAEDGKSMDLRAFGE